MKDKSVTAYEYRFCTGSYITFEYEEEDLSSCSMCGDFNLILDNQYNLINEKGSVNRKEFKRFIKDLRGWDNDYVEEVCKNLAKLLPKDKYLYYFISNLFEYANKKRDVLSSIYESYKMEYVDNADKEF